ncbi:MAG: phosphodiester glycosidase family protein [Erysipelotrichaceae bacterium]|nr:phosphodiester glycosidase family protein [Erysipelotrichaceae bacterium]
MESTLHTYPHPDGEIQRVQRILLDDWQSLQFLQPQPSPEALPRIAALFREFFVKQYPYLYGRLFFFRIPEGLPVPMVQEEHFGEIEDPLTRANVLFRKYIRRRGKELSFLRGDVRELYEKLKAGGDLLEAEGKLPRLTFLPLGERFGFLSETEREAALKVNANFFVMDQWDCASVYDRLGTPVGLCLKDDRILNPPSFEREVLTVSREGKVRVSHLPLSEVSISVGEKTYRDKVNARFYTRLQGRRTPAGGTDLILCGERLIAVKKGGKSDIPSGGMVIRTEEELPTGREVSYHGGEELRFALQTGSSAVIDGVPVTSFRSPFYRFWRFWEASYPPAMYPLNYRKDRAPRIILGADKEERPLLLWFEGAAKIGHQAGTDSCGATLLEAAEIAAQLGVHNGIQLDGGGSAEILLHDERKLLLSDRDPVTLQERERPIPLGLFVR